MEKKKIKFNYILYLIIAITVILMLIFGYQPKEKIEIIGETPSIEKSEGSGFLEVETFPGYAEIYVDRLYSGKSPITLYNVHVGLHDIVIKKEGYEDFIREVNIEAGKKTFLEARLASKPIEEKVEVIESIEEAETKETAEEKKEEALTETPKANVINIGKKFTLYYDFSERKFTELMHYDADVFSKRYDAYLVFTRFNPVNIKTINKNINDVEKEDCTGIRGQFEWLYSGQSLCVITKENSIAAIGGSWDNTENAELKWKVFG